MAVREQSNSGATGGSGLNSMQFTSNFKSKDDRSFNVVQCRSMSFNRLLEMQTYSFNPHQAPMSPISSEAGMDGQTLPYSTVPLIRNLLGSPEYSTTRLVSIDYIFAISAMYYGINDPSAKNLGCCPQSSSLDRTVCNRQRWNCHSLSKPHSTPWVPNMVV